MTTRPLDEPSGDPSASGLWYRRENLVRFVKFGLVGGVGVGVNWMFFEFGIWLFGGFGERIAYGAGVVLGIAVSILTNFVFNDVWTWGDRRKGGGVAGWLQRMARYYVAASVAGAVQFVVFWLSLEWIWGPIGWTFPGGVVPGLEVAIPAIDLAPRLSLLTGIACGMILNFVGGHLWAFREVEEA